MKMDVTIFAAQWRMMRWHCTAMDNASAAAHIDNPNCETRWCGGSTPAEQSGQGDKVTWPWWYGASLGGSKTRKRDILRVFFDIGEVTPHQLPTTIVTRYCGCTNILRTLGHGKCRVLNLNSNSEGNSNIYFVRESQVPPVETNKLSPRIGSDFVPTLRVGIPILYLNLLP